MKMYKKDELTYENGYITKNGKIIGIDNEVVDLLNRIETDYQHAVWVNEHPSVPAIEGDPFMFKTERGNIVPNFQPVTPALDKAIKDTMAIMDDLDSIEYTAKINKYFGGVAPVIEFVTDESVVSFDQTTQHRFDLATIGNPLELDIDKLSDIVETICK